MSVLFIIAGLIGAASGFHRAHAGVFWMGVFLTLAGIVGVFT